jgi:CheY-like chemotaxis protein
MADTKVLLVEDDADDVFMIRKVLDRAPFEIELVVRENGRTALRYLSQFTGLDDPALPSLVLLDLNMPVMDGHALLHAIRNHDRSRIAACRGSDHEFGSGRHPTGLCRWGQCGHHQGGYA